MPLDGAIESATAALGRLLPQEVQEICSYIEEPQVPDEVQQAASAASAALREAKAAVELLKTERQAAFEAARTAQAPPAELRAAVEAVCTMLEARPDFHDAQSRCELASSSPRARLELGSISPIGGICSISSVTFRSPPDLLRQAAQGARLLR